MRAKDVMTTDVISVQPESTVRDIARTLLERRISAVPVVDAKGTVIGIVSEGDLMRREESKTERHSSWWLAALTAPETQSAAYVKSHAMLAKDVMTADVVTVDENTPLNEVAGILEKRRIKRVPVLRNEKLVGIVSRANLLHGLIAAKPAVASTQSDQTIRGKIMQTLRDEAGVRAWLINVIVTEGIVQLWGMTESEPERKAAILAAERTAGVRAVEDHLGVISQPIIWAE